MNPRQPRHLRIELIAFLADFYDQPHFASIRHDQSCPN